MTHEAAAKFYDPEHDRIPIALKASPVEDHKLTSMPPNIVQHEISRCDSSED